MVRGVLRWVNREFNGLHEAALLLAVATFASQLLSLVQSRLLASTFGAGQQLDVFYAAFRIPDFLYVSVASFVSISVLIPLIVKKFRTDGVGEAKKFLDEIFTAFCLVMFAVALVAYFVIPLLKNLVVPGFGASEAGEWVILTRIILLSPILLGLSNLFGSFTQSLQKFFIYALSPIFYQTGNILGIAVFYRWFGLPGLALGTALGAFMHLAIQLPTLWRAGLWPEFTAKINFQELKQVILISLPRTLAMSASQLATLVLVSLASLMAIGSITVFNLAYSLQGIPVAIIGASYSVAAFPALVKLFHAGNREEFDRYTTGAVRQILFWSIPATVLFVVLRAQIVRVIFGAGNFSWSDTRLTAAALALFVISVAAQCLALLFVRGYYAAGKTLKPVIVNVGCSLAIVVLAYGLDHFFEIWPTASELFNNWLRVDDLSRTSVLALPLAFTLGSLANALIFWILWRRDFGSLGRQVNRTFWQSLGSGILAGVVAYIGLNLFDDWFNVRTLGGIFLQGFASGMVAIFVNIILLKLLGNQEIGEIETAFKKRFWKTRPVAPEMPEL